MLSRVIGATALAMLGPGAGSCGCFLLVLFLPPPLGGGLFNYLFSLLLPLCRSVHFVFETGDATNELAQPTPASETAGGR
jgi:hypothetical protein